MRKLTNDKVLTEFEDSINGKTLSLKQLKNRLEKAEKQQGINFEEFQKQLEQNA